MSAPAMHPGPGPGYASLLRRLAARREARALSAAAGLAGVFFVLLIAVRGPWLPGLDLAATRALQEERARPLDLLFEALTAAGGGAVLIPSGILVALWLGASRRPRTAILAAAAALLGHPLAHAIKTLADRPRPSAAQVDVLMRADGSSFPSGHALASALLGGFLAVLAWTLLRGPRRRRLAVAGCVLFPLGVGVSRVYVGGHWASDVVGGWACGLLFLLVWVAVHRRWAAREITPMEE